MSIRFPTLQDVLAVGEAATGAPVQVRDTGLLLSALQRPQQTVFGAPAYASVWDKAAALLHSFTRNHALVDGNKRTGLALAWSLLVVNGAVDDSARDVEVGLALVLDVAQGRVDDIGDIAVRLQEWLILQDRAASFRIRGVEPASPPHSDPH